MLVTDTAGTRYVICDRCRHWTKRPLPRCDCLAECHDKARRDAAERTRRDRAREEAEQ